MCAMIVIRKLWLLTQKIINMTPTDTQLKSALTKMLPDLIYLETREEFSTQFLRWFQGTTQHQPVKDTELLHLCWLVEETLPLKDKYTRELYLQNDFSNPCNEYDGTDWTEMYAYVHATWQQRTIALCKVKGITV